MTLISSLLRGELLDVNTVMKKLDLEKAGARRHLDALEKLAGIVRVPGKRARTLRLEFARLEPAPAVTTAFAACVGAGFATLFSGAPNFQNAFKEARAMVLRRARQKTAFKDLDRKFLFHAAGGEVGLKDHPDWLDHVIAALVEEQRLRIKYEHVDGPVEVVTIEPLSLMVHQHQVYVVGRDPKRPGHRYPYRFARISDLHLTEETFIYPAAGQYSPERMFLTSFGVFITDQYPVEEIKVRLTGSMAKYASRHLWHPTQNVAMDGLTAVVTFQMRACPEVVSWILSLGPLAEVLEPVGLRKRVAAAASETARIYGSS